MAEARQSIFIGQQVNEHDESLRAKRVTGTGGALATEAKQDALIGNYALKLDDTTTTSVTYVGKAAIGSATSSAVWQIKKIDETTGMSITWADGDDLFDNVWDNRATTETYS